MGDLAHFNTKHGMFGTKTYWSWAHMIQRCTNPHDDNWSRYGGRGIIVCARWRSFDNFFAGMGVAPEGLTLERKDVNADYAPGNCEWATKKTQANNRRTNVFFTHDGKTMTLSQWAEAHGIDRTLLRWRLKVAKWPMGRALNGGDARRANSSNSRYGT